MKKPSLKPWILKESKPGPHLPLFETEFRWMENPRNHEILKALVLHSPDTVNVIAMTHDHQWVLVEQFRFGIDRCLVELPAGLIDGNESPIQAAKRELLEETGYIAPKWILIGDSYLNPAYVTNRCFHFLAVNAKLEKEISPDATEDLKVHLEPVEDLRAICQSTILTDAVGNAALASLQKHLNNGSGKICQGQ